MRGTIALDVDGTITAGHEEVPPEVLRYLSSLIDRGWTLVFVTGRTYLRTLPLLKGIRGTCYLAVQNGAQIFELPSQKCLSKKLIAIDVASERPDVVVYSSRIDREILYWKPDAFSDKMRDYVIRRAKAFKEELVAVEDFPEKEAASLKFYGEEGALKKIELPDVEFSIIRDPFSWDCFLGQATALGVNKGSALERFREKGPLIVCGDDWNDVPMFAIGDLNVVMETAPQEILQWADIVAPSAEKLGIIEGLTKAIG